jgi:large subunit ribosomal protein L21
VLDVDRFTAEIGDTVELNDVLLLSDGGQTTVGTPTVADARVLAEVIEHGRDDKVLVFKYKNKTRYRRRFGHRQSYTRLAIRAIGIGDVKVAEDKPKKTSRKTAKATPEPEEVAVDATEQAESAAEAPEMAADASEEAPTAKKPAARRPRKAADKESKPAPKPRARKSTAKPEASADKPAEE